MTNDKRWVLVTGASTGIGKACTEYLAAQGFGVYAGARKDQDLDNLGQLQNVVPVKLDVTNDDDVQAVLTIIEGKGTGLFGLVNNAGIGIGGPLMDITADELQLQFAVNMLGVHRVTRAVFPLIFKAKGRIVMMSSYNGRLATPFLGPYVMSKFGLEGYSDVFRQEMLPFGVKVILVEPGAIKTSIWEKNLQQVEVFKNREHSVELLAKIALAVVPDALKHSYATGKEPAEVAKVVHEALTVKQPLPRYPVMNSVWKFKIAQLLGAKSIDKMVLKEFNKIVSKLNES
jgi:NAD(P)-dependent dehydrogenase (short-subunit alcohol dehydrogenase family)